MFHFRLPVQHRDNADYLSLTLPVWMVHGVRGDFTSYNEKTRVQERANWRIDVLDTGAMPHFERREQFSAAYDDFLSAVPSGS